MPPPMKTNPRTKEDSDDSCEEGGSLDVDLETEEMDSTKEWGE